MTSRKRRRVPRSRVAEAPLFAYGAAQLLLDTHAWLWLKEGSPRVGRRARAAIASATSVHLSIASSWEMAVKSAIGKVRTPSALNFASELDRDGFRPLAVTFEHIAVVRSLPLHHRDPFDRMLIAQAMHEGLTIVTADPHFARYPVGVIDATR